MPKCIFIVDFSWDPNRKQPLKIFELGDYFRSQVPGIDDVRAMSGLGRFELEILASIKKEHPNHIYIQDTSIAGWTKSVDIYDFSDEKPLAESYNDSDPRFLCTMLLQRAFIPEQVKMRGLVASLNTIRLPHTEQVLIEAAQKNQRTNFSILNHLSGGLIRAFTDKVVFYEFCKESPLLPETLLVNLNDQDQKAIESFLTKHPAKKYIIKPPNSTCGQGLVVAESSEVLPFITWAAKGATTPQPEFKATTLKDQYWSYPKGPFLLLQECCPSKQMLIDQMPYCPTGRVVVEANFSDAGTLPALTILGSNWKFPKDPLSDISVNTVISSGNDSAIHPKDLQGIYACLNTQLSPHLLKMYNTSSQMLAKQFQFGRPVLSQYGTDLFDNYEDIGDDDKPGLSTRIARCQLATGHYFNRLSRSSIGAMDVVDHFVSAISNEIEIKAVDKVEQKETAVQANVEPSTARKLIQSSDIFQAIPAPQVTVTEPVQDKAETDSKLAKRQWWLPCC